MKTAFKILPSQEEGQSMHLLAEVGYESVSFLFFTKEPLKVEGLLAYQFESNSSAAQITDELKAIVESEDALKQSFSSVNILYALKEATLVPRAYHNPMVKEDLLALLYGSQKEAAIFDEHVRGKEIVNIYRVSKMIVDKLRELFPFSVNYHTNTLLIPQLNKAANELTCIVYHSFIKIILQKDGLIQIAQQFSYTTATDIVYHLLNTCSQFGLAPDTVVLSLSGMIDERSALYKELYNYFLQIEFSPLPAETQLASGFEEFPAHFFQHLILLSACV